MAITHFTFGRADASASGVGTPAMIAGTFSSEGIVPSGSNQQTTAVAPSTGGVKVCRVATDTAVYVAFGSDPNASTGTGARALIPAGGVDYFVVNSADKAAVVTA